MPDDVILQWGIRAEGDFIFAPAFILIQFASHCALRTSRDGAERFYAFNKNCKPNLTERKQNCGFHS